MIKIEKTDVYGWKAAIRGMRNPMNSWDKIDSGLKEITIDGHFDGVEFIVGENDHDLMMKLAKGGSVHAKYRRMITVTCDITAPLYWWKEMDQYKIGTVTNSTSTMHRLLAKPFDMNDFSFDKLPGHKNEVKQFRPEVDEDQEVWCKTFADDFYEVSNFGRIRHDGRILSGSIHKDGYIYVNIRGTQHPVHVVVAEAFIPHPYVEGRFIVNHKDGNKQNNTPSNLEWCTQSENVIHAYANGLQPKGLSTYKGKFTAEQREEIKSLWDGGVSRREIARRYGVSHTCINDIINDKYKYAQKTNVYEEIARPLVDALNELRDSWLSCDSEEDKKTIWYSIIQLLPSSYNQKRTVLLNYEVLVGMYRDRKNHKLDEWHVLCDWIEKLPYSEVITLGVDDNG